MKKKFISLLMICILLLTAILPNYIYADDDDDDEDRVDSTAVEEAYGYTSYQQLTEDATTTSSGRDDVSITKRVSSTFSLGGAAGAAVATILVFPFWAVMAIISIATSTNADSFQWFTIEAVVFNEIPLLDANYMVEDNGNAVSQTLKNSVLTWYYIVRVFSIAASVLVLMYIGIRLAIASVAAEKAKYKQALVDWFLSFAVLFLLHYFIIIVLAFSESLVGLFGSMEVKAFETKLSSDIFTTAKNASGWSYVGVIALYIVMVFYEIKFFLMYLRRLFAIGFLIVISPLITITYSIDRFKDGKAQAFTTWMREFIMFCMSQPIHAGLYVVFINTAYEIFQVAPLLAVIFFAALSHTEHMVRNLLGMKDSVAHGEMRGTFKFNKKD